MYFVREFGFPLTPVAFEIIIKIMLTPNQVWHWYFSSGTLMVTFAIWCMLTSIRTPSKTLLETDKTVEIGLKNLRTTFTWIAMIGLLFYGSLITAAAIIRMMNGDVEVDNAVQSVFAFLSLCYSGFSLSLIWWHRETVGSLVNA